MEKQQQSWKVEVGFSDRLATIVSITSAYRGADPSIGFPEAQQQAKATEEDAFNTAESKEDYHSRCRTFVEKLLAASLHEAQAPSTAGESVTDEIHERGIDIGEYEDAVYHKEGIFSTVYKAKGKDAKAIALKLTTPSIMTPPHNSEREARILRKASSPHVITLLESFRDHDGHFILAFPFMPHNLDELLQQQVLTDAQKKSHLRDLFHALRFIHEHDIIHRDVKPSNILLASPSGPAYLADFGIAWTGSDGASEPAREKITDVGTTSYRAPELLFGNTHYGTALDIWAAGCVVAEAMKPDHKSLFESGPLGSELALIHSIFSTLGTPDLEVWPEARTYPDWGKMQFYDFPARPWDEILSGMAQVTQDLVGRLVRYESAGRMTAAEAVEHPFFAAE